MKSKNNRSTPSGGGHNPGYRDFALPDAKTFLTTGRGNLPIGAPMVGEIQIFAKSAFNSCILSSKQGCPNLYHLEVGVRFYIFTLE